MGQAMSEELLPVLASEGELNVVSVEGQAVVTARALARALGYKDASSVIRIFNRNRESFRERHGQFDRACNSGQIDHYISSYDTGVVKLTTPSGEQETRYFTKRGALKVCMKSNQPKAIAVQEILIDLYEAVESQGLQIAQARYGPAFTDMQAWQQEVAGAITAVQKHVAQAATALQELINVQSRVTQQLGRSQSSPLFTALVSRELVDQEYERAAKIARQINSKGRRRVSRIVELGLAEQVLGMIAEGMTYANIAQTLQAKGYLISESSVGRFAKEEITKLS